MKGFSLVVPHEGNEALIGVLDDLMNTPFNLPQNIDFIIDHME